MNNDILFIAPGIVIRSLVVRPRANAVEEREAAVPSEERTSHERSNIDSDGE